MALNGQPRVELAASDREVVIEVEELTKTFGPVPVLNGIDLKIRRSEVVCIIGPSGSGKSTLLRCLAFLDPYTGGRVSIEGNCWATSNRASDDSCRGIASSPRCAATSAWSFSTSISGRT